MLKLFTNLFNGGADAPGQRYDDYEAMVKEIEQIRKESANAAGNSTRIAVLRVKFESVLRRDENFVRQGFCGVSSRTKTVLPKIDQLREFFASA